MQAALNIDGLAFCTLEIDGASMPPAMNLIHEIIGFEGFGIGAPTMRLSLIDKEGVLSKQLNLKDGTRIKIRVGKDASTAPEYKFRVFGRKRRRMAQGAVLDVACIYDSPEFCAGSFSESFEGTSREVMAKIASACGLGYDGPKSTDDHQVWLNLNTTRLAFTEDMTMRAYVAEDSCMYRMLTLDGTLRYKNLFEVLREEAIGTISHNTSGGDFDAKEVEDGSVSGLYSHFLNYGQDLYIPMQNGDLQVQKLNVPIQGDDVPVNADIRQTVKARVAYAGYDYGTAPLDGFNVHQFYEQAYYQNLRFLSLFSERLVVLVDSYTGFNSLKCVEFNQADPENQANSSFDANGKYVLGGKTFRIKHGTRYSEALYLYRPFTTG